VSAAAELVRLCDVDLLLRELDDPESRARLAKLGMRVEGRARLEAARTKIAGGVDRRWMVPYERAHRRYGRGIAAVRERVCQGCHVTLPTSATPRPDGADTIAFCQSCGRLLYWG
jgi:predicted  nucleic acid-binding Zn-ribbon protein